ncbi:MAG: HEAT repeat domain-containing protein [SAR324 cluster bacterium]|nr:HEAT repeat domain-containing protein [SAR324 cluster bacterium]
MEETISDLINKLDDPDEAVKLSAIEELGYPGMENAIIPLVYTLRDNIRFVAEAAADALIRIGTEEVAEAVSPLLATEETALRNDAAEIMAQLKEKAVPALMMSLRNENHDVRQFAVDTLSQINSPETVAALVGTVNDPNENVAAGTIDILGDQGDESVVSQIVEQINRSEWVKGACLRALGKIGGDQALEAILGQAKDSNPLVLLSVVQALGQIARPDGIPMLLSILAKQSQLLGEEVINALEAIFFQQTKEQRSEYVKDIPPDPLYAAAQSGKLNTRLNTIKLLGDFQHNPPFDFLIQLYSDEAPEIRRAAMHAVVNLKPKNLDPVTTILDSSDSSMESKAAALDTLGRMRRPECIQYISDFLDLEDITLQRVALNALYAPLDKRVQQKLKNLLSSPISEIRTHALIAVNRLKDVSLMDEVITRLHDEDEDVRSAADEAYVTIAWENKDISISPFLNSFDQEERRLAFQCFSERANSEIIPQLSKGLKDPDSKIRVIAIKALVNAGPDEAEGIIADMLHDADDDVVATAIWAYGELKAGNSIHLLKQFLAGTNNSRLIYQMLLTLGNIGASESIPLIQPYLQQDDTYLKFAAIEGLQKIGGKAAFEALDDAYSSEEDFEVMEALEEAIERIQNEE